MAYKEVSWTGIINGIIPEEKLDCISLDGSLVELLNKNPLNFSIRPLENGLFQNGTPLIIVNAKNGCSGNPEDYFAGRRLNVSGSFSYKKREDPRVVGILDAYEIEFL